MTTAEQLRRLSESNSNLVEALQLCKEGRTNEYLINRSLREEIREQEETIDRLNKIIDELEHLKLLVKDKAEPLIVTLEKSKIGSNWGNYVKEKTYQKVKKNLDLFISKYHEQKERADKLEQQIKQSI